MKATILFGLAILATAVYGTEVKPQTKSMPFTYQAGSTAAYPPGTGIIYQRGQEVLYTGGASCTYVFPTTINFPKETEFYAQTGPKLVVAGSNITFPGNTQVAYGPGTHVIYASDGETKYAQFNGNTHSIATYPSTISVQYYYGSSSNLVLFNPGTNPMMYYNPGGSTRFGPSALPVEKDPSLGQVVPTTKTYGYSYGGNYGYSYCSGYSYNGWPQTSYYNNNYGTPYRSTCAQTCYNCYNYNTNNAPYYGGTSSAYYGGGMGGGGVGYGK